MSKHRICVLNWNLVVHTETKTGTSRRVCTSDISWTKVWALKQSFHWSNRMRHDCSANIYLWLTPSILPTGTDYRTYPLQLSTSEIILYTFSILISYDMSLQTLQKSHRHFVNGEARARYPTNRKRYGAILRHHWSSISEPHVFHPVNLLSLVNHHLIQMK